MNHTIANKNDKWLTLIGTIVSMFALGTIYTWSLFNTPLAQKFSWRVEDVAFTFAIISVSLSGASLLSSKLCEMFGVRKVTAGCAVTIALGLFLASKATALWQLYLTAGFLVGAADGIGYMMILANCMKWFPNSRGVISGIAVSAYGLGSFVFKFISIDLMKTHDVSQTFIYWGGMALLCLIIGAIFLRSVDESAPTTPLQNKNMHDQDFNWHEMIRVKEFWLLAIVFFCCCMSGLFLIAVASNLAAEWEHLTVENAAKAVSIIAIANTLGRLVLGKISDNAPRIRVVHFICLLMFLPSVALLLSTNIWVFTSCIFLIAFAFGGTVAVFPALIGDFFGLKNMAKNYSIIYQGFGIGGVLGMFISVWLGGFSNTFILVAILTLISFFITLFIKKPIKTS